MDVLVLIKESKELVTFLKATGLVSSLSKRVLQEVETRWNSIHTMLASVLEMYDEIQDVLSEHGEGEEARLHRVDRGMLRWLVPFLLEFKEGSKTLEGDNATHPTLPYVLLVSTGLRDHCEEDPATADTRHLAIITERCLSYLHAKFVPSMKAKVATFLWPDYKDLTMLTKEEKDQVTAKVRSLLSHGVAGEGTNPAEDVDTPEVAPPKAPRLDDRYKKYRHSLAANHAMEDEVTRYLNTTVSVPPELLQHWKMQDRPDGLPKLAKLAIRELGKLATAAPSERIWSKAAFILNKRRNKLGAKHLDSILFLASYLRELKKKEARGLK